MLQAVRSSVGQQPAHRRLPEDISQTFLEGVPVQFDVVPNGGIIEWDGVMPITTNGIVGVSKEGASGLTTFGVPKVLTYGKVNYQPGAVKIPAGAPMNDARIATDLAVADTVFKGQVGPSQSVAATDFNKSYGMTKDSDGHWYIDKTATANPVVKIVGFDQFDTVRGVRFVFLASAMAQIE
jgi:hypothetical protein